MTLKTAIIACILALFLCSAKTHAAENAAISEATSTAKNLAPGTRGISLPLPGHQLMFVKPGDRIDILITIETSVSDSKKEKIAATILQNVMVVAVYMPPKPEEIGVIKLQVDMMEAQYAALSCEQGRLLVSVRAPGDTQMYPIPITNKLIK